MERWIVNWSIFTQTSHRLSNFYWEFPGIQELLSLVSSPLVLITFLSPLLLLCYVNSLKRKNIKYIRELCFYACVFLIHKKKSISLNNMKNILHPIKTFKGVPRTRCSLHSDKLSFTLVPSSFSFLFMLTLVDVISFHTLVASCPF